VELELEMEPIARQLLALEFLMVQAVAVAVKAVELTATAVMVKLV
jgi:hypothetical protein